MNITNPYIAKTYEQIISDNPNEPEFHQAVGEVFESIAPVIEANDIYEKYAVLERIAEPERIISFKVTWVSDDGKINVNKGYRVQFNSAIGPYKGGLRFHPSVNTSVLKFLAFEQVLKNSLTGLPLGGGKGGADFDPKGKSDMEIMRFCQSFMSELFRHIGADTDIPAGDIGVGSREVGYLFGQYKRLANQFNGVLTGKGLSYGGSLGRKEATGYGLCYFTEEMLHAMRNDSFEYKDVAVSGSGNVAIHAIEKIYQLKGLPITASDSNGFIYDPNGINLDVLKQLKEVENRRIADYEKIVKGSIYYPSMKPWAIPCDIALPCATQNELNLEDAKNLVNNNVMAVVEGANMPCTPDAIHYLRNSKVLFGPAKAANAGGVAVSGLEMSQNAARTNWSFEEVDDRLRVIMKGIFNNINNTAKRYCVEGDFVAGANMAGFIKVADAMIAQGIIF
ncbi:MAG TPA: NADP-specific glutamate dehydrogenase [Clostridia bacterium]|nr:NADP-specific glutamate dehydrogenase [Clostridia bacterium]